MPNRGRRSRGRGVAAQAVHMVARKEHVAAKELRVPFVMPTIKQGIEGERWVRFTYAKPSKAPAVLQADNIATALFGSDTAKTSSGTWFILKRLRVWATDNSPAAPNLSVDVIAIPNLVEATTPKTLPFTRHFSKAVEGSTNACVYVEMGEQWRIHPLGVGDTSLVAHITCFGALPADLLPVTVDALVHVFRRNEVTATIESEPQSQNWAAKSSMSEFQVV
jgi:hypothetical protein